MYGTMKRIAAAMLAAGMVYAAPASAQATRTWISGVGDDANPCSRTAPCKTFAGAISKTATGGQINCVDPGAYGAVTITKSISLLCDDVQNGVLASSGSGININSATATVVLSGFDLEGFGNGGGVSINGINIINATAVHIRNSKIRGFRNGYGINFSPQASNPQLFVDNVTISESGITSNAASGGIGIVPAAGLTATATITNTRIADNQVVGIRADTTGIVGSAIRVTLNKVSLTNNGSGMLVKAPAGTGTVALMLTDSKVALNAAQGMIVNGTGVTGRVGNSVITQNGTGLLLLGSAQLLSYGDNYLGGNTSDGAFSGVPIAKK